MDLRTTLPADPRSAGEARRVVRETLTTWGLDRHTDAAQLLVSELTTNAVLHARSDLELVLVADGSELRVEVCDGSPVRPQVRHHSLTAATGRGIRLLDAVAARWGVVVRNPGKCVWFALDGRDALGGGDAAWAGCDIDAVDVL